ncbi:hypothetical protein DWF00_00515 [Bosea caraganae]|uniref:Uncharacterized protein n=1 Tax=Bosea caraganae TaxID=2763117 RepID=A0A370L8W0_9HYPH|nr:hypothetical protein [Bosea caraganae]RDJ26696.1 hypothetical protein DWE98_07525 [Bosea caraganae]RDJ30584.1 hypothetical protein DWF00_00515 [Bosea caraganae]
MLGAILLAALTFSLFTLLTGKGARINEVLGELINYWLGLISILIIAIVICYVLKVLNIQTYDFEYYAFRALRFMTVSIYDAGIELWARALGS